MGVWASAFVDGGDGDDSLTVAVRSGDLDVTGGSGNDTISVYASYAD